MTAAQPEFVALHTRPEHPGLGTIVLSRPPTNALSRQMYRELVAAVEQAELRDDIAVVILYGGHEIFSVGDDVAQWGTFNVAEAEVAVTARATALATVADCTKPTVAAVTGYALGSGLALALAADWRVAGDNVKVGATEVHDGVLPDRISMSRLADTVGTGMAKEMAFSGRFIGAEEADDAGLFDQMVAPDTVYDAACTWAGRFVPTASARPELVAATKVMFATDRFGSPNPSL